MKSSIPHDFPLNSTFAVLAFADVFTALNTSLIEDDYDAVLPAITSIAHKHELLSENRIREKLHDFYDDEEKYRKYEPRPLLHLILFRGVQLLNELITMPVQRTVNFDAAVTDVIGRYEELLGNPFDPSIHELEVVATGLRASLEELKLRIEDFSED